MFDPSRGMFNTPALANALPQSAQKNSESSSPRPQKAISNSKSKLVSVLKTKQERRRFRGTSTPDPTLGIDMDDFISFSQHLASSKRIFALLGAGLSASSGLVTFRGSNRHWRDIEPQDLSNIDEFWKDPAKVWWFFSDRMKRAQEASPNLGHIALAKLAREKMGFFAVNQNIDGICQRAGFPQEQIAQIHGTLFEMKCSKYTLGDKDRCDYSKFIGYPVNEALTITTDISDSSVDLPQLDRAQLPHCPKCDHLMRPSVVLFGEATPSAVTEAIYDFTSEGPIDLMLVIGTSATVLPAAMYIPVARNCGARVAYFNLEECEDEPGRVLAGDWMFQGDAAEMVPECLKGVVGNAGGA